MNLDEVIDKRAFLIEEARRWIGIEESGNNSGQLIEMWQKSVDGKSCNESWCMSFVQAQINWVDRVFYNVWGSSNFSSVVKSESCVHVWNNSPQHLRWSVPIAGSVAIWQNQRVPTQGHTGIVSSLVPSYKKFLTIEGNTSPGDGIVREGQGVYEKTRSMDTVGDLRLLGFLVPWV